MKTAQLSQTKIAYVDEGRGLPILLVHGFPLDHSMWEAQIAVLSPHSRVIAPDLRGFGGTPLAPGDAERGVSMEAYADDLIELLAALAIREPVVLVGFSMGGYVAWQFVRKHVGKLRALIQCDTKAKADNDEARAGRLKMAESVAEWGSGRVAELMEPKLFAPATVEKRPEVVAEVRSIIERTPPAGIAAAQRGMATRLDVTSLLPSIQVPTLVLVGEHDVISPPSEMKEIADAIPGAGYVTIPRAGHMTSVEEPAAVNEALLEFVRGRC
jgi:pimeloyl-ACP methyl ester carboxylesterase